MESESQKKRIKRRAAGDWRNRVDYLIFCISASLAAQHPNDWHPHAAHISIRIGNLSTVSVPVGGGDTVSANPCLILVSGIDNVRCYYCIRLGTSYCHPSNNLFVGNDPPTRVDKGKTENVVSGVQNFTGNTVP